MTVNSAYSLIANNTDKSISREVRSSIDEELQHFIEKLNLGDAHIHLYIKEQQKKRKGNNEFKARIHLTSDFGDFYVTEESFGVKPTLKDALSNLEQQVEKKLGRKNKRVQFFEEN